MNLQELRQNYELLSLDESEVDKNPIAQFEKWMSEAIDSQIKEPNAMTLATISAERTPTARIVLLKEVNMDGQFVFFTNYNSNKAKDIAGNSRVCLLFLWLELHRQVRIEGQAVKVSKEISEAYFQSRPKESQLGAWVSPQSKKIKSRAELDAKMQQLTEHHKHDLVLPLPEFWGGYAVQPTKIEFWQGRTSRLHDRVVYQKTAVGGWYISRLAP